MDGDCRQFSAEKTCQCKRRSLAEPPVSLECKPLHIQLDLAQQLARHHIHDICVRGGVFVNKQLRQAKWVHSPGLCTWVAFSCDSGDLSLTISTRAASALRDYNGITSPAILNPFCP